MEGFKSRNWCKLPYLLVASAALLRLMTSYPYNFIPVFACILFFGATRPKREFPIPVLTLVGVDIFLTIHRYGYALTGDQAVTWVWYLAVAFLGAGVLRSSASVPRVLAASLLASVSFFLASNFAVWYAWALYPHTGRGLATCYIAALPFFRNSVISETVFSLLIFGIASSSHAWTNIRWMETPVFETKTTKDVITWRI